MTSPLFRKTIFISLLGHIAVFSIFSFSFGNRIAKIHYGSVSFWGGLLNSYDFISHGAFINIGTKAIFRHTRTLNIPTEKLDTSLFLSDSYFKPAVNLALEREKIILPQRPITLPIKKIDKRPVVMFHPVLPYHFTLYFKDRQMVHIQLMFNISTRPDNTNSISLKRKISSGNLEVDLLSMHYISHYLFIQQARFPPNSWQTVKIEFSPRND